MSKHQELITYHLIWTIHASLLCYHRVKSSVNNDGRGKSHMTYAMPKLSPFIKSNQLLETHSHKLNKNLNSGPTIAKCGPSDKKVGYSWISTTYRTLLYRTTMWISFRQIKSWHEIFSPSTAGKMQTAKYVSLSTITGLDF